MTAPTQRARRAVFLTALAVCVTALPSCAWSNQDNRPVWNAFERNLVPDDEALFVAALPLTVPLGLASIVVDAVVAHPIQVVDDSVRDAGSLWDEDDMGFDQAFYTEMACMPFRTVLTPLAFAGSFAGRVLFDLPPHREPRPPEEILAEEHARHAQQQEQLRVGFVTWLENPRRNGRPAFPEQWHDSFAAPLQSSLAGDARNRRSLHLGMLGARVTVYGDYRAEDGLRDADPVVRYLCVENWPMRGKRPAEKLVEALCADSVESVRLRAQARFEGGGVR